MSESKEDGRAALELLEEIDGLLDAQVYGLWSGSPAVGMRNLDLDVPADFEHDVIITEALWDKIRKAIKESDALLKARQS